MLNKGTEDTKMDLKIWGIENTNFIFGFIGKIVLRQV